MLLWFCDNGNEIMAGQAKKREWFDLGATAYDQACPGKYAVPTYVCPICRDPFAVDALIDGRLSVEHVPPQSVGVTNCS